MKTKIILFITLLVALLSVFAFTVSAEVPEWTAMQYLDDMADKATFGADGTNATATSRVMLAHEVTDETTGEITTVYTTYPAYYVVKNSTAVGFSFTEINKYTDGITYAAKNVVRIEFPNGTLSTPDTVMKPASGFTALQTVVFPQGFTTIGAYTFKNNDNEDKSVLEYVEIPSTVTTIGEQAFYRCLKLKSLIIPEGVTEIPSKMAFYAGSISELYIPSTVTSIGTQAFYYALDGVKVTLPEKLVSIGEHAFKGSGVTEVCILSDLQTLGTNIFDSSSLLTSVYCKSKTIGPYMFANCSSLTTVRLENTVTIGLHAFYASSTANGSITTLNIPDTVTSIGNYAFARAKITSVVIPESVTTIGLGIFKQCTELESAVILCSTSSGEMFQNSSKLSKLVFTEKFDTLGSGAFSGLPSSSTIFYTGSDYSRMKTLMSSLNRVSQAKYSSYESYKAGTHTTGTYMFIYDANLCEVGFDSNHIYTGDITPTFEGQKFLSSCDFGDFCTRCSQGQIIETLPALFINKGYAYSGDSMLQGFAVNRELLSKYESYLGNIKFGLVAAYCGTGAGFDTTDGELITATGDKTNEKIAAVDFTSRSYDLFEMKITGLSESHKQTSFYINAYIIEGGKVYYIDNDQTTDTAVAKSHNEIVAIVESKE
ncbi:MAG: leucine-rich repeat domain-containing protein [Clostridia bacterium]|nr:leucine-rich repeat domain-containing protein [Clostridia bacterium]